MKKLNTPFKIWFDENQQEEKIKFIELYDKNFFSTNHSAYYWGGDHLAHQYSDLKFFQQHHYPEVKFEDIMKLDEPQYEVY